MPPEENIKKNNPNLDTFRVGNIDPIFRGNPAQQKPAGQNIPASAYNVLGNQQYVPSQTPVPPPLPNKNAPTGPKSIIRTFKGDVESAIETSHLSSVNIALAENERMREQIKTGQVPVEETGTYSKSKVIIFVSFLFIVAGIGGLAATYFIKTQNPTQTVQTQELPSLFTTEFNDELNVSMINKDRLVSVLSSKLNDVQITVNNFDNVFITTSTSTGKRLLTASEFTGMFNLKIPNIAQRTLLPNFMVGMYSFGKNLPFIILKTSSFENTYSGMLAWEKTMEKDFELLFRLPGYEKSGGILENLEPTVVKSFDDGVISNKDVRLLRDDTGQIILLYGIIDKETIIITVSDTAFKEIINRLNKEKGLKR